MASITLLDFSGSGSFSISIKAVGTICQERPNLSLSQPHGCSSPPAESFDHSSSTSSWDWQGKKNDTASVNLYWGPPFKAVNCRPSSSNEAVMTFPLGPGPAS